MTAIAGVLVVLTLLIAPYLRPWVTQRSQISAARQQIAQLKGEVTDLTTQRDQWNDPAYVEAQARTRLRLVMPGEISYSVLDDTAVQSTDPRVAAASVPQQDASRPWYQTFWGSVNSAGDPGADR